MARKNESFDEGTKVRTAKKDDKRDIAFLAIPGGLLMGMGIGFIYGNLVGYMFIGLGAGFILGMIVRLSLKKAD